MAMKAGLALWLKDVTTRDVQYVRLTVCLIRAQETGHALYVNAKVTNALVTSDTDAITSASTSKHVFAMSHCGITTSEVT